MTTTRSVVARVSIDFNRELNRIKRLYGYKTTTEASNRVYKIIRVNNNEIFKF